VEVRGLKSVEASVGAVTSLNNELFVALNNLCEIHVYDADDLQFLRSLPVNGLGAQVSCRLCLVYNLIHRVICLSIKIGMSDRPTVLHTAPRP